MLKLLKILIWTLYRVASITVIPLWCLIFRYSSWKGRPWDFLRAILDDEQVKRLMIGAGMAGAHAQLRQTIEAMVNRAKGPTQEDLNWWMFIQNYGENPQPDMVPEYLAYLKRWKDMPSSQELPAHGATDALCARHRDLYRAWTAKYADLFCELEEKAERGGTDRPGWNDYHMARWFVERDDKRAAIIAERTKLPGIMGSTCTWMANSVAQQIRAFREALERVGYEFPPDIKAAILHDSPEFKAAVQAERHYPMSQESCNEFLESLQGATITRAEMMTIEGEANDDYQEHVEIITSAGMFCICAPDLGISYTKQTERSMEKVDMTPERIARNEAYAREHPEAFARFEDAMRAEMERNGAKLPPEDVC